MNLFPLLRHLHSVSIQRSPACSLFIQLFDLLQSTYFLFFFLTKSRSLYQISFFFFLFNQVVKFISKRKKLHEIEIDRVYKLYRIQVLPFIGATLSRYHSEHLIKLMNFKSGYELHRMQSTFRSSVIKAFLISLLIVKFKSIYKLHGAYISLQCALFNLYRAVNYTRWCLHFT